MLLNSRKRWVGKGMHEGEMFSLQVEVSMIGFQLLIASGGVS